MIEINLVPDVKQELIRAQRQRAVVISSSIVIGLAALGVLVVLLVYIFGAQTVRHALADSGIKDQSDTLAKVQGLSEMLTIQNQVSIINKQADSRMINSRIFNVLESVVPPEPHNVRFSRVSVNAEDKTIVLEGQTPRYESMETFKKTLERAYVLYKDGDEDKETPVASNISLGSVSFGEDAGEQRVVRFNVTFTYAEELFLAKYTFNAVAIKAPDGTNVTDSRLGVRDIFIDKAKDEVKE